MKSGLLSACAVTMLCVVSAGKSEAQTNELLLRLEAKLDALTKENAALRARVNKIETARQAPAAPVRVTAPGTASATPTLTAAQSAANAAYVPAKAAPMMRSGCARFAGWTVGANVGWGYSDSSFNDRDGFGQTVDAGLPLSTSVTDNGVVGGVQAGYNWQRNCTVFGFEADWSWSGLKASALHRDGDQTPAGGAVDTLTVSSNMKWFGTVRGRAGVVVDDVLLYATAGLAYANFRHSWTYFQDGPVGSVTFSSDDTKFGLVAGFGAEWQVANSWSFKSEALYMAFEKSSVTGTGNTAAGLGTTGVSYRLDSHDSVWVARLGANYRFGGSGI